MPRLHKPKTTEFWRIKECKIYLTVLNDADGQWVDFSKIEAAVKYAENTLKASTSTLLRIGLIETRHIPIANHTTTTTPNKILQARITPSGRRALSTGKFTYRDLIKTIQVPGDVYDDLVSIANELKIYREAGEGTGSVGSITGLLREIVIRQDAFKKWYRYINSSE